MSAMHLINSWCLKYANTQPCYFCFSYFNDPIHKHRNRIYLYQWYTLAWVYVVCSNPEYVIHSKLIFIPTVELITAMYFVVIEKSI